MVSPKQISRFILFFSLFIFIFFGGGQKMEIIFYITFLKNSFCRLFLFSLRHWHKVYNVSILVYNDTIKTIVCIPLHYTKVLERKCRTQVRKHTNEVRLSNISLTKSNWLQARIHLLTKKKSILHNFFLLPYNVFIEKFEENFAFHSIVTVSKIEMKIRKTSVSVMVKVNKIL